MESVAPIEPVSRETTASIIAQRIREGIRTGTFPPGAQLGEARLAEGLQVSRGPVREALQRLIQEGLLRSEPHRGVFVVELDRADAEDVYLARRAVERAAVRALLASEGPPALDALNAIVADMEEAARRDDWARVADLDLDFHSALVAATGSPRLVRMFETLGVETRLCLGALERAYPVREDLVAEHRDLLAALRRGVVTDALDAVERHFDDAVRRLATDTAR